MGPSEERCICYLVLFCWFIKSIAFIHCNAQEERGREVMPGNLVLDTLMDKVRLFAYMPAADSRNLQTTCFQVRRCFESHCSDQILFGPIVEADLENAMFYRLWGPYHGYPIHR